MEQMKSWSRAFHSSEPQTGPVVHISTGQWPYKHTAKTAQARTWISLDLNPTKHLWRLENDPNDNPDPWEDLQRGMEEYPQTQVHKACVVVPTKTEGMVSEQYKKRKKYLKLYLHFVSVWIDPRIDFFLRNKMLTKWNLSDCTTHCQTTDRNKDGQYVTTSSCWTKWEATASSPVKCVVSP